MIVFLTILSLVSGLVYGYFDVESSFISAITQNTHIVLYILMLVVLFISCVVANFVKT